MKLPKFLSLLQTQQLEGLRRFQRYIRFAIPRSTQIPQVMDYLMELHPNYAAHGDEPLLRIEKMLQSHPSDASDNKRRGNFFARLYIHFKDFLAIEQLEKDPSTRYSLLLQALKEQGNTDFYNEVMEEALAYLQGQAQRNTDYHLALLKIHHDLYYNTINNKFLSEDRGLNHLHEARKQLYLHYRKLDLKYSVELENHHKIVQATASNSTTTEQEEWAQLYATDILVQLYQKVQNLQQDDLNEEKYRQLVQLYRLNLSQLAPEDQGVLLRYLNNAAANLLRNHYSVETLRFSFELADLAWRHQLFYALGGYTPIKFLNYVEIALSLNELDWLAKFIDHNIKQVPVSQREEIHALALANYYFGKKDFPKAIDLLVRTKSADLQVEFRIRMLYCKIFYKNGSNDALESMLKSFDTYLRRSDIFQEDIVRAYLNFLKLLRLLLNDDLKKLEKLLPTTVPLYGRIWLEQQLSLKK